MSEQPTPLADMIADHNARVESLWLVQGSNCKAFIHPASIVPGSGPDLSRVHLDPAHNGSTDTSVLKQRIADLEKQLRRERETSRRTIRSLSNRLARRGEELAQLKQEIAAMSERGAA